MKISFLIATAYGVGGTIRTTLSNASELARRGHEVEVVSVYKRRATPRLRVDEAVHLRALTDSTPSGLADERATRGPATRVRHAVRRMTESRHSELIHPADARYVMFNLWSDIQLYKYLRSVDADVIVGTRPGLNVAIARWARPCVVRVAQEHMYLSRHARPMRNAVAHAYPGLDAVVALTATDAGAYRELLGEGPLITAIPNAAPAETVAAATGRAKVVSAAGRLAPQKGFDYLIDAFAIVVAEHRDWELRIYGDGDLRQQLQEQIDELDLADNVFLEGYVNPLLRRLRQSSIYAMTSRYEGFPMVLLEAMSAGLPCVSFDLAHGPADIITDGVDGRLVADRDPAALARALGELIEDDELRTSMGHAAVAKALEFDQRLIGQRWEELFDQLVRNKPAGIGAR